MKPSQVVEKLELCVKAHRPTFLWGAPGIGKSDIVRMLAAQMGVKLLDERMGNRDPVDVKGLPIIENGVTLWTRPDFLPAKGKGILFIDEMNVAPPLVQAACYQLVLDRRIGQHKLGDGWDIIAAGNRETDRAVTHRMSSALASRFVHIDFDVDLDDWVAWAFQNNIAVEVIAFLRFRPNLLHNFDPTRNDRSYPAPRTWEFVSDLIRANNGVADYELIAGTVGEGAATEFMGFIQILSSLPDIDDMLKNPAGVDISSDPSVLYAICGALVNRVSDKTIDSIVKIADRMSPEFGVLLMRDALRKDAEIAETNAFIKWAGRNADVLVA